MPPVVKGKHIFLQISVLTFKTAWSKEYKRLQMKHFLLIKTKRNEVFIFLPPTKTKNNLFLCLTSSVLCLLSHISCLMSPDPFLPPFSRLLTLSRLLSHNFCLLAHMYCLMSPVSCLFHISCLSHVSCQSPVSCLSPLWVPMSKSNFISPYLRTYEEFLWFKLFLKFFSLRPRWSIVPNLLHLG